MARMPGLDWLTARPVAHRGLHDRENGIIENSESAVRAAVEAGFAIEVDIQETSDGEAVVYHDFHLDRLTDQTGRLDAQPLSVLEQIQIKGGNDRIISLQRLLEIVDGKVPLVVEIKSTFNRDLRLARRVAEIVCGRAAPIAIKSFDPDVIAFLQAERKSLGLEQVPLGMVAEANYAHGEWAALPHDRRIELTNLLHFARTRPDFLSWHVSDLPHASPHLCRVGMGLPVMTWTVRTPQHRALAAEWADQMVFEGFVP